MSKFLKVMIVMLTIAAMAMPVIAEDRLGLSGQMRVRGWNLDDGTDTTSFMDQRLRIGGKFTVAEGVSVTFRTDVTEQTWGNGGSEFGSGRLGLQQWDRAHLDLTKGNLHLRAGQQYVGFGMNGTVNSQDAGLRIDVKGDVNFSAFWLLDDTRNITDNDRADSYLYGANVAHKTDSYKANVFFASQTKANDAKESAYLLGADVATSFDAIKVKAELDFFFGDANATQDVVGTQLFVDASMAASDTATVGAQLFYALAADADEVQYENLGNDFGGWDAFSTVGTSLSNEKMSYGRPFDLFGGAGVMAARLYGNFKTSDAVKLGLSVAYIAPEDDSIVDSSAIAFTAGATYKVMANTSLQAQLQYLDIDEPDADAFTGVGVGLFVNF